MSKNKEAKKVVKSKEVKKSKKETPRSDVEVSAGTLSIVKLAKREAGATAKQTTPGVMRVYIGDTPILKLTGLSNDTPTVRIRPKLRGADFKETTGLVQKGSWKQTGSTFEYTGDGSALAKKLSIFLKRAKKIVA